MHGLLLWRLQLRTLGRASKRLRFDPYRNRLNAYNFLIVCWSALMLVTTAWLHAVFEAGVWQFYILLAMALFQLATTRCVCR